jgi:hypothetical protein
MRTAAKVLNETVSLSHGTLELYDHPDTMRFYRDFLGIGCERHHKAAMNIFQKGEWLVACVKAGKSVHPQGPENAWILNMKVPEDVDHAHDSAVTYKDLFKIKQILPVERHASGMRSFLLQDLDSNWWQFRYEEGELGRWVDAAFARGDVA